MYNAISNRQKGEVYLVGAGPGDPDLITVKGVKTLEKADVVVYDRLANPDLLAYAPESAEHIFVGKKPGKPSARQEQINAILIQKARHGKTVVRLKGGDPFIFGRGGEECLALRKADIPYHIVPGISSSLAVPASVGIPLTHRKTSRSLTIVTGHTIGKNKTDQNWSAFTEADSLVILMGIRNMAAITQELLHHGKPGTTPAAVIEKGTLDDQKVVTGTLADIAEKASHISSPGIIVIGETAAMAHQIGWLHQINQPVTVTETRKLSISM